MCRAFDRHAGGIGLDQGVPWFSLLGWMSSDSKASQRSLQGAEKLQPDSSQLRPEFGVNIWFIFRLPEVRLVRADEYTSPREARSVQLATEFEIVF